RPSLVRSDFFVARALEKFIGRALREHTHGGMLVADVGCGEQPWRALVEHLGARYVGTDVEQNAAGSVALRCAADRLPLRDASADLVLCTEVLEHVPDPGQALREVRRVLRPGGVAIVSTPFLYPLHEEPWDFQRLTRHQLERLVRQVGLAPVTLATAGNEVEVWATLWDRFWSDVLPPALGPIRTLMLATFRAGANLLAAALSALAGRRLARRAYLSNLAVLRAPAP
ncbi:MAG TPA: class I SAM-dependent methyltransferase, partial [Gemmatimonadales bacterium]|nr:class I SAM-dependent methyltransferase [Gemmatimonadales bacterium]